MRQKLNDGNRLLKKERNTCPLHSVELASLACLATELLVASSLVEPGMGHLGSRLLKGAIEMQGIIMILIKLCLI